MFRYRLRTLLILTILGPPMLSGAWWSWLAYSEWRRPEIIIDWTTITPPLIIQDEEKPLLTIDHPE